jgi:AcrR family transcriptional regulator
MKTKDRILDVAITLFNAQGTGAVSTNHIAEALAISPGNLYYHFPNKEAIIRAIFEQLFARWDEALDLPTDRLPTLADVTGLVRINFITIWDYAFIYREMLDLLRRDPMLHERYRTIRQRGYEGFCDIVAILQQTGVLSGLDDADQVRRLADLCWLISEFWLATVELRGEVVDEVQMEQGIALMMQVLQPYLKP